ncbi:MAG: hypothetical protein WC359_13490 [Dehalococcoidia bacterium]|jgi:hypothetical protein
MTKALYYAFKLRRTVTYTDPITGKEIEVKPSDCAGYIPVYETEEEAFKESEGGKHKIGVIIIEEEQ